MESHVRAVVEYLNDLGGHHGRCYSPSAALEPVKIISGARWQRSAGIVPLLGGQG